ncbi:unnamed protein product, partial [Prunus brigantina]
FLLLPQHSSTSLFLANIPTQKKLFKKFIARFMLLWQEGKCCKEAKNTRTLHA